MIYGMPLAGAQVERQMVWGGCAAMVIRGKVVMEPLIAQVPPSAPSSHSDSFRCPQIWTVPQHHSIVRCSRCNPGAFSAPQENA